MLVRYLHHLSSHLLSRPFLTGSSDVMPLLSTHCGLKLATRKSRLLIGNTLFSSLQSELSNGCAIMFQPSLCRFKALLLWRLVGAFPTSESASISARIPRPGCPALRILEPGAVEAHSTLFVSLHLQSPSVTQCPFVMVTPTFHWSAKPRRHIESSLAYNFTLDYTEVSEMC